MTNGQETSRLERIVGRILLAGAAASTTLLAAGLVLALAAPGERPGSTLTAAGLVILIATPVARVVASVADYAAQRDWLFVALTGSVLTILLGSFLVALGG